MDFWARERSETERRIQYHVKCLIHEKRKLNELAPVARLPSELLAEIFSICALPKEVPPLSRRSHGPEDILIIAQTCHHWREVALSTPLLWSSFLVSGPPSSAFNIHTMLSRSNGLPLEIGLANKSSPDDFYCAGAIFTELYRIRRLDISDCTLGLLEELTPQFSPALQCLALQGDDTACELGQFENCELPSLQVLRISSHRVLWTSPLLRKPLLSLHLINIPAAKQGNPTAMLDALESMPRLQTLELHQVLPADNTNFWFIDRRVHLPDLSSIRLNDAPSSCDLLLRHLVFPASARMSIICSASDNVLSVPPLLSTIAAKLNGPDSVGPAPTFLSAMLSSEGMKTMTVSFKCYDTECRFAADEGIHPVLVTGDEPPSLSVTIFINSVLQDYTATFRNLLALLPLTHLRALYLYSWDCRVAQIPAATWLECCSPMAELRELCVVSCGEDSFAEALLAHIPSQLPVTGQTSRFLPSLETLYLDPLKGNCANYSRALHSWKAAGMPLKKLVLLGWWGITPRYIEEFSPVVDELQWMVERTEDLDSDSDGDEYLPPDTSEGDIDSEDYEYEYDTYSD